MNTKYPISTRTQNTKHQDNFHAYDILSYIFTDMLASRKIWFNCFVIYLLIVKIGKIAEN